MRLALFATLWARSQGGVVVASTENRSALDDLEWVGIEPDQMARPADEKRAVEVARELVEAGKAYPCYCSGAEFREMPVNPLGFPEPMAYDGRCRELTASDRATMEKMGRKPRFRILLPEDLPATGLMGSPQPVADFAFVEPDGSPSDSFGAVLGPRDAEATAILVHGSRVRELAHWQILADALGWTLPELRVLPPWTSPEGALIAETNGAWSISALRAQGYVARALMLAAARAGWDPGDAADLAAMTARFDVEAVSTSAPILDPLALQTLNGEVLRALGEEELVHIVGDYLERKGYPFMERDPAWQKRFVRAAAQEMKTLSDAEAWAGILLTSTVDYDKEVARTLRLPATHELIDQFEKAMVTLITDGGGDPRTWRSVLNEFRQDSSAPGRALATMRLVLSGQREGPSLASILSLLGVEGCKARLEKARRYTA